ncbi:hypothetical protein ABW19_dt0201635 [Dactylella cylindrospora]|nr:hypothetical protein ABW19_dt0201635 [Dactylella cylindrospora]
MDLGKLILNYSSQREYAQAAEDLNYQSGPPPKKPRVNRKVVQESPDSSHDADNGLPIFMKMRNTVEGEDPYANPAENRLFTPKRVYNFQKLNPAGTSAHPESVKRRSIIAKKSGLDAAKFTIRETARSRRRHRKDALRKTQRYKEMSRDEQQTALNEIDEMIKREIAASDREAEIAWDAMKAHKPSPTQTTFQQHPTNTQNYSPSNVDPNIIHHQQQLLHHQYHHQPPSSPQSQLPNHHHQLTGQFPPSLDYEHISGTPSTAPFIAPSAIPPSDLPALEPQVSIGSPKTGFLEEKAAIEGAGEAKVKNLQALLQKSSQWKVMTTNQKKSNLRDIENRVKKEVVKSIQKAEEKWTATEDANEPTPVEAVVEGEHEPVEDTAIDDTQPESSEDTELAEITIERAQDSQQHTPMKSSRDGKDHLPEKTRLHNKSKSSPRKRRMAPIDFEAMEKPSYRATKGETTPPSSEQSTESQRRVTRSSKAVEGVADSQMTSHVMETAQTEPQPTPASTGQNGNSSEPNPATPRRRGRPPKASSASTPKNTLAKSKAKQKKTPEDGHEQGTPMPSPDTSKVQSSPTDRDADDTPIEGEQMEQPNDQPESGVRRSTRTHKAPKQFDDIYNNSTDAVAAEAHDNNLPSAPSTEEKTVTPRRRGRKKAETSPDAGPTETKTSIKRPRDQDKAPEASEPSPKKPRRQKAAAAASSSTTGNVSTDILSTDVDKPAGTLAATKRSNPIASAQDETTVLQPAKRAGRKRKMDSIDETAVTPKSPDVGNTTAAEQLDSPEAKEPINKKVKLSSPEPTSANAKPSKDHAEPTEATSDANKDAADDTPKEKSSWNLFGSNIFKDYLPFSWGKKE